MKVVVPVGILREEPDEVVLTADGWVERKPGRSWTEIQWIEVEDSR